MSDTPRDGHIVINKIIHPMDGFYLTPNGNGVWTWSVTFKIDGKLQAMEGGDFPSKSRALWQANAYGCCPSDHWLQTYYPTHEEELEAA